MTTVNDWDSLVFDTKMTILVALGVLDSPLCEIKMSTLNKQHINETGYLASERRSHFTEAASERYYSNLCLVAIIAIIKII